MPTEKDQLEAFCEWWLNNRPFKPPYDSNVVTFDDGVIGMVLFRDGTFQVQMFCVKPFTEIVDHVHPDVDSFEVYVGGDIFFRKDGQLQTGEQTVTEAGTASDFGRLMRITPTTSHGGSFGPKGGVFLSLQHWRNGVEPSSVHLNWGFDDPTQTNRNHQKPKE